MNVQLIDQIPSAFEGLPGKFVGLREDGAFGLVERPPLIAVKSAPKLARAMMLSDAIALARAVVAGDARTITAPTTTLDLAVSVLAIAAQLGSLALDNDGMAAVIAELRSAQAEEALL